MTTDEKLYTIINHPQHLTDEQVEEVLNDPQLADDCKSLLTARRLVRQTRHHVDVEEALRLFKRKHADASTEVLTPQADGDRKEDTKSLQTTRCKVVQLAIGLLAVAAMVAGFVFLLRPPTGGFAPGV